MRKLGIISFFSVVFFIFTAILLFSRKRTGNLYMVFGVLTFAFILLFGSSPSISDSYQSVNTFLIISIMLLLFGMMNGIITLFFFNLPRRICFICSILSTVLLMAFFFNLKGIIVYMYVPVLLVSVLNKLSAFNLVKNNI